MSLKQEIDGYAQYFKAVTDNKPVKDYTPQWMAPMEAIDLAFATPWYNSPQWEGVNRETFLPSIEEWLKENHVAGLARSPNSARGYNGWTAEVFEARIEGVTTPQMVRIGAEGGAMPHLSVPWNPFVLQSHTLSIFMDGQHARDPKLALARGSPIPMVEPGEPLGFDEFLNRHIFPGTPWKLHDHKDWSILSDGTPLNGDPTDSVSYASRRAEINHGIHQSDPAYQQEVMATIHANSERAGLPTSMRWVVESSPGSGVFVTKQSLLLPDPLPHALPARTVKRIVNSNDDLAAPVAPNSSRTSTLDATPPAP